MRHIKYKLLMSYTLLTFFVLSLTGGIFYWIVDRYSKTTQENIQTEQARLLSNEILHYLASEPSAGALKQFIESLEKIQQVSIQLDVFDNTGNSYNFSSIWNPDDTLGLLQRFFGFSDALLLPEGVIPPGFENRNTLKQLLESDLFFQRVFNIQNTELFTPTYKQDLYIINDGKLNKAQLSISKVNSAQIEILKPAMFAFGSAALFVLLLAIILGWKMGSGIAKPLIRSTIAVNEMRKGNLHSRINEPLPEDEIGTLATQINSMAEQLEFTLQELTQERDSMKKFILDASHELRTPITASAAFLELLENKGRDDEGRWMRYVSQITVQNNRMKEIVNKLMSLIRLDRSRLQSVLETVSCSVLIYNVIDQVSMLAELRNVTLILKVQDVLIDWENNRALFPEVLLKCEQESLETAVRNIVENGIHAADGGGSVEISVMFNNKGVTISIQDSGTGLADADINRIFDTFFRSTHASYEGSGLGLALAKSAVERNNGTITVRNALPGDPLTGAYFQIHVNT